MYGLKRYILIVIDALKEVVGFVSIQVTLVHSSFAESLFQTATVQA